MVTAYKKRIATAVALLVSKIVDNRAHVRFVEAAIPAGDTHGQEYKYTRWPGRTTCTGSGTQDPIAPPPPPAPMETISLGPAAFTTRTTTAVGLQRDEAAGCLPPFARKCVGTARSGAQVCPTKPMAHGEARGCEAWVSSTPARNKGTRLTRLATSVRNVRRDQKEPGSAELHTAAAGSY